MKQVTIVDYGRSNLLSVQRALEYCGAQVEFARTPAELLAAHTLVLPGVGAFADGMAMLAERGLVRPLLQKAAVDTPLLGICLGMQLFFAESLEGGPHPGLGLLPGRVVQLPQTAIDGEPLRVPHVGWAGLRPACGRTGFSGTPLAALGSADEVYFVHGYQALPEGADCLAETIYGGRPVCAAVQRGSLLGVQFHPEKSGEPGLSILAAFLQNIA